MKFFKYHKIHQLGHEDNVEIFHDVDDDIYIEEKVDGGNFRVMLRDGIITLGTRTQQVGTIHDEGVGKQWNRTFQFLKETLSGAVLPEAYIFYGEAMVRHSINYDWDRTPPFLGFDVGLVRDDENRDFLPYDEKKRLFEELGLPMVPLIEVVKAGKIQKITDDDLPQSAFYDGPVEGLVYKNYSKGIFAKYVSDKFKEVNRETFGGGKKHQENDDGKIVAQYCTNARIEKQIFQLLDKGEKLEMQLMTKLPRAVTKDMWDENWQEITTSHFKVDFHRIRKLIAGRCGKVLQQMITNQALNR